MRIILSLLILISACNIRPEKNTVSFKELETLQGTWSGMQAVLSNDDVTVSDYPTQVVVTLLKDSLELSVTNTYDDGHQETEKGILSINKNDSILRFGGSEYNIEHVIRTKEGLMITAFKEDEDNDKPAEIRLSITMHAKELIMLRDVRYIGTVKYLRRINLELKRK